ncbi:MAG: hypothetical protein AB7T49_21030 [Oligoflexales bacterium]
MVRKRWLAVILVVSACKARYSGSSQAKGIAAQDEKAAKWEQEFCEASYSLKKDDFKAGRDWACMSIYTLPNDDNRWSGVVRFHPVGDDAVSISLDGKPLLEYNKKSQFGPFETVQQREYRQIVQLQYKVGNISGTPYRFLRKTPTEDLMIGTFLKTDGVEPEQGDTLCSRGKMLWWSIVRCSPQ